VARHRPRCRYRKVVGMQCKRYDGYRLPAVYSANPDRKFRQPEVNLYAVSTMTMQHRNAGPNSLRGITLLEVLISIGVLSIGLVSVAALVPAGKSQAARATVMDRAGIMAANAIADACNFGLIRPEALTTSGTVVIDLGGGFPASPPAAATARAQGVYSGTSAATAPPSYHRMFMQSRDDIVLTPAISDDDLPTNLFVDGVRGFDGRTTCMYVLASGTPSRLSVVVFHNRDPSASAVAGSILAGEVLITSLSGLGDRTAKEVLKPNAVLYAQNRFHQIIASAFDASGNSTFLTLSSGTAITASGTPIPFQAFPDSVGLSETAFRPETSGPYLE